MAPFKPKALLLLPLLLLAPVLLLVATWPALAPTDPDYWWHVRTGQLIVETGGVPTVDPYSFTAAGQPWVAHEWLAELAFFVVQHQFGYAGNVVLIGLLGAMAALAMFATCRLWGVGELPSVVLVLWAFGMSLGSLGVRPQTITRVMLAGLVLVLSKYRRDGNWRWLMALPPIFLLWVNLHGGFAIGLGLLGLTLLGSFVEVLLSRRSWSCLWPLAAATLASVGVTLINPSGLAGSLYPLAFLPQATGGQQLISEWQPPDLRQLGFLPFGLSLVLALALGFGQRPLRVVEVFWALAFAVLALQSIRNIQLYATVVTPLLGARLCAQFPAFGRSYREWRHPRRMAILWSGVSLLCAGVWFSRFAEAGDWPVQLGAEPDARQFPVGGAAYLRDHHLQGKLFNQFEWGGYLIYADYPEQRVFIDGRPDMYGNALFGQYVSVVSLQPTWRDVLDARQVQLVLVARDGPLAAEISRDPRWAELYAGSVERLFQRQASTATP